MREDQTSKQMIMMHRQSSDNLPPKLADLKLIQHESSEALIAGKDEDRSPYNKSKTRKFDKEAAFPKKEA